MRRYSIQEKITVLRYSHLPDKNIAALLPGRTEKSVTEFRRHTLGIVKDDGFQPGRKPWNAGMTMNPDNHPNLFKKGNPSPNKYKIGTIYTRKREGLDRTYIVTEGSKKYPFQQYLYELHHNISLPKGTIVVFLDKNTQNFSMDNLRAVTRAEQILLNRNAAKSNATRKKQLLQIKKAVRKYGIKGNQTF